MIEELNLYSNVSSQANTYSEEDMPINTEQDQSNHKCKNVGQPREQIWKYYITSNNIGSRSASCYYCPKSWSCGCPGEMEAHLANICPSVPKNIKEYWQESLSKKIKCEHPNILTNQNIFNRIGNEDFFRMCKMVSEIFNPIKETINIMESKTAMMSDCFIGFIKLAAAINRISDDNNLKIDAIKIFNRQYEENDTIIPSIDELLSDYEYLPLGTLENQVNKSTNNTLEDQVNKSTNNTLMISETIDITNLSFSSDGQLQVNMPTNSNLVENQNWLGNMNNNTEDLVNRMFEMNDE
ncbi:24341_t:CDS:2 [Cetraspora pellucida]|uniref:24341_t:CDS:1 n=1 Tax=Cetraspora pellucida TaxID=1433469 RepID=A0A9N9DTM6_9GLOM|nr:24341_t:CDS:2 [Cetraspora pellucida]